MPKKGGKAKLKKKQKKQQQKAKQKPKTKQAPKDSKSEEIDITNGTENGAFVNDPDKKIKEFIRDIHIHSFSLAPIGGGKPLIRPCPVRLIHGHRYGLIGYNGAGKTTMLKKLASGNLKEIPPYLRVLLVQQELEGTDQTVLQTVLKSDTEREFLLAEEAKLRKALEDLAVQDETQHTTTSNEEKDTSEQQSLDLFEKQQQKLKEVEDRLKFIEADTAEKRASEVLRGLGFTDRMKNMKTSDLSGGWRMRVSLAMALFVQPDLLLLDEPTNHLDFPSVIWLSEYLECDYPMDKTVVIVSHDRRFLNDVCTDIIHLEHCYLRYYTGNYDTFLQIRRQKRIHTKKQYERQEKKRKHNLDFIARFKANKKWSTQAQSRAKMLSKLPRIEKVLDDHEFRFYFPDPPPLKNPNLFHLTNVTFGYFGEDDTRKTYLLDQINVRLQMGTKVGILGANGTGKSTLVRLIMQELDPIRGTAALSNQVGVGFFAQHHMETLDYNATPLEHLKNVFGEATQQDIYKQLGRFSLGGEFARRKIGTLSGGQKSRVAFAILTWYTPHLIVMDEPTNHLDLPTIDALALALCDFKGSVILVSHDQHFVETVCDEYWAVGNRTVKVFDDFEKCRHYSFNKCKPVDVLPREFSTVEVKKRKYIPISPKRAAAKARAEEKEKEAGPIESVFVVDPERAIDRGLQKGLTPDQILRHVRGWKPVDGNTFITDKLGFIMFHDYFDKNFFEVEPVDFFDRWRKLVSYCVPNEHIKNQKQLVDITHACWKTAFNDKNKRAVQTYSFGMMLETMYRAEILIMEAITEWRDENQEKALPEALKDIERFMEALEDEDEESESDDY